MWKLVKIKGVLLWGLCWVKWLRNGLREGFTFHAITSSSCSILSDAYCKSSHPEVFLGKGVLKICSKFTGEHLCWIAVSIKLQLYLTYRDHELCLGQEFLLFLRYHMLKNQLLKVTSTFFIKKRRKFTVVISKRKLPRKKVIEFSLFLKVHEKFAIV